MRIDTPLRTACEQQTRLDCEHRQTVVGIDVGGEAKGFHAVALQGGNFIGYQQFYTPSDVVKWCLDRNALVVAVDAPCAWSHDNNSRKAERELKVEGKTIQCFKTPTRQYALASNSHFYDWIFNGEKLFKKLANDYSLFDGDHRNGRAVIETFPHAVVCALNGKVVPAGPKSKNRREALYDQGCDHKTLRNIDFVDAAICALTAEAFRKKSYQTFGHKQEGFIVVPSQYFRL